MSEDLGYEGLFSAADIKRAMDKMRKEATLENLTTAAKEFKRVAKAIMTMGREVAPRGKKVKEEFNQLMVINPIYSLPHFVERPFLWRYFTGETAWYLSKERDPKEIIPFSDFWDKLRNPDGTVNSNYGELVLGKQLRWAYDSLCTDEFTRQAVVHFNTPEQQWHGNKDFVCTLNMLFFIRDNTIYARSLIRSQDIIRGYCFDIPWFCFLLQHMYVWLKKTKYPKLELGYLYHFADNIHVYEEHYDLVNRILATINEPEQPEFRLSDKMLFEINEDGKYFMSEQLKLFISNVWALSAEGEKSKTKYIEEMKNIFNIYIPE